MCDDMCNREMCKAIASSRRQPSDSEKSQPNKNRDTKVYGAQRRHESVLRLSKSMPWAEHERFRQAIVGRVSPLWCSCPTLPLLSSWCHGHQAVLKWSRVWFVLKIPLWDVGSRTSAVLVEERFSMTIPWCPHSRWAQNKMDDLVGHSPCANPCGQRPESCIATGQLQESGDPM